MQIKNFIMKRVLSICTLVVAYALISAFFVGVTWSVIEKADFDSAIETMSQFYQKNRKFSENVTDRSYKGWDAVTPYETQTGYYECDNNKFHSYLMGIHTIQDDNYRITIDTSEKLIVVTDVAPISGEDVAQLSYKNSLTNATAYKSATTANGTIYRAEFNAIPSYSAYNLDVATNGQLRSMVIYYRDEFPINPKDQTSQKVKPKLEVAFTNFKTNSSFGAKEFDTGKYITLNGKALQLTTAYSTYQLTDARITK